MHLWKGHSAHSRTPLPSLRVQATSRPRPEPRSSGRSPAALLPPENPLEPGSISSEWAPLWSPKPLLGQGLGLPWILRSPSGQRGQGTQQRMGSLSPGSAPPSRPGARYYAGLLPSPQPQASSAPASTPTAHLSLRPAAHVLRLGLGDGHAGLTAAPQPVATLFGPRALGPPGASAGAGGTREPSGWGGTPRPRLGRTPQTPGCSPSLDDTPAAVGVL